MSGYGSVTMPYLMLKFPTTFSRFIWLGEGIPIDFKPSYAEHKIDVKRIIQFEAEYEARRQEAIKKVTESKEEEDINWDDITDYYYFGHSLEEKGDYKGARKGL